MSNPLSRQRLFENVLSARRELMRSLMFLSEEEATTIPIHEDWTIRDVISHIVARECLVAASLHHLVEEGDPGFRNPLDERAFNLGAIQRRRDFPLRNVIDELDGIRRQLTHQARKLLNRDLFAEHPVGNTGETTSLAAELAKLAEHDHVHAEDIWRWRAANSLMHRDRFRRIITSQREDFLNALGGLFEADLLSEQVCGHWTAAEVMAHMLSWDEETYQTVIHWSEDRTWQAEALYDDDWNEIEVVKRASLTVIDLADGLATQHRRLVQHFDQLSDEELAVVAQTPWGERMSLMSFLYEMAQHNAAHTPDLRSLSKRVRGGRNYR